MLERFHFTSFAYIALFLFITVVTSCKAQPTASSNNAVKTKWRTEDIWIRDPFVYVDSIAKTYYLYAQLSEGNKRGVKVYTSNDLISWDGPFPVFYTEDDFWAKEYIWAPEVHHYKNKYYLFATLTSRDTLKRTMGMPLPRRGTQIFVADSPMGPFKRFANRPHTPLDWVTLDGTLYIESNKPWMVFCHEWIQITDGTIDAIRLKEDLSATVGEPITLFKATDGPWVKGLKESTGSKYQGYVTDGPYFYKTKNNSLLMIWSSFGDEQYAIGIAVSESGKLEGPWKQLPEPLFKANGGHGMIFKTFEGQLMLVLHQPNTNPNERMKLFPLVERENRLFLK